MELFEGPVGDYYNARNTIKCVFKYSSCLTNMCLINIVCNVYILFVFLFHKKFISSGLFCRSVHIYHLIVKDLKMRQLKLGDCLSFAQDKRALDE